MSIPAKLGAFLLVGAGCFTPPNVGDDLSGTIARVVDGDSIVLETSAGEQLEIRLFGIDAPEHDQPYGTEAKQALARLLLEKTVLIRVHGVDRYDRILGCPLLGELDVCLNSVQTGSAWVYRSKTDDAALDQAEKLARDKRLGIWGLPPAEVVPPWLWRAQAQPATDPGDCKIKGNINRHGERIYHLPGQRHYRQTGISAAKGERWFCSESEAVAAGWRRSKR
ncbi:MAG: thermonuclease family protein [Pseudomonadales bacterium]